MTDKARSHNVDIRPLQLSDASDLRSNCFPSETYESVNNYVRRALHFVEQGQAAHLVAEAEGEAVANAQLLCWRNRAEIGSLVVSEPLRGQGIGTALIEALSHAAAHLGAEQIEIGADKKNRQAIDLYRRLGFIPYKEIHLAGRNAAEDLVYMIKPVPPSNAG